MKKENDRKEYEMVQITPTRRIPGAILLPFYSRPALLLLASCPPPARVLPASCFKKRAENTQKQPQNNVTPMRIKVSRKKSAALCTSGPSSSAPLPEGEGCDRKSEVGTREFTQCAVLSRFEASRSLPRRSLAAYP